MTHNRTILLFAAACGLALSAAACGSSYGDECSFPEAFVLQNTCPDGEFSSGTCIYNNSAECETGICIAHEEKQAFCTQECEREATCAAGATCDVACGDGNYCLKLSENAAIGYCVPKKT